MQRDVCCICGDPVLVPPGEDDAVCHDCFEKNLRGACVLERPAVVPPWAVLPVRRRELAARDRARWPLTGGR